MRFCARRCLGMALGLAVWVAFAYEARAESVYERQMSAFRKMGQEYQRLQREAERIEKEIKNVLLRYAEVKQEYEKFNEIIARNKKSRDEVILEIADREAQIADLDERAQKMKDDFWAQQENYGDYQKEYRKIAMTRDLIYDDIQALRQRKSLVTQKIEAFNSQRGRLKLELNRLYRRLVRLQKEYEDKKTPLEGLR